MYTVYIYIYTRTEKCVYGYVICKAARPPRFPQLSPGDHGAEEAPAEVFGSLQRCFNRCLGFRVLGFRGLGVWGFRV